MFGQQPTTGNATSTPNLFGSTAPSGAGAGAGGFSFGNTAGSTPSGGFSFGQTPKPGGFSFGGAPAQPQAQPQAQQAPPSFSFGGNTAAAATTKPAGGFAFGTTPTAPAQTQQPAAGLSFGGTSDATKPAGGFAFGTAPTAPAQPTQPAAGLLGAAAAAKPAGGFSFGAMPTASVQAQQPTPGLSLGAAAATKPAGGFGFGTTAPTQTSQPAPGASFGGGLTLGQGVASVAPQATSAAAAPAGGFNMGGGGFKMGGAAPSIASTAPTGSTLGAAPAAAAAQPSQAATSTAAGGGLGAGLGGGIKLGGFSVPTAATPSAASAAPAGLKLGTATTTTTSAPGGLSLGAGTAAAPSLGGGLKLGGLGTKSTAGGLTLGTPASSAAGSSSGLGLLGAKPGTTAGTGLSMAVPTVAAPAAATATMSYRELEECINKWTVELEEQEKIFLQQASQVNAWDRMLVNNGEKITLLHNDLETVKTDQQRLEHELDYIVAQQRELEDILVPLEDACKTQEGALYRQHTDVERERTYQMSENIDSQLKRMVQDLKEIIDHMNTSSTPTDQADPINQVAKILNAHMNSLQWIDQNSSLVQRKVDEVTRQYEIVKRDQERNVHLAFE